jgi:uncharacterized protein (TIGR02147 family)
MPNLLDYHDYREYLLDVFNERKSRNPLYSYRRFATQLGIDSSQCYRIMAKDLHLPVRFIPQFVKELGLQKRQQQYFEALVGLGRAKTEVEKRQYFREILGLQEVARKVLTREQLSFFSEWHHATMRCLAAADAYKGDWEQFGKCLTPPITGTQARQSVDLLIKMGLLIKNGRHGYQLGDAHLTTGQEHQSQIIRDYQAKMLRLASDAAVNYPKEKRNFSSLTFAVDKECLQDIKAMMVEFRRQVQRRIAESGEPELVHHLSLSLFQTGQVPRKAIQEEV